MKKILFVGASGEVADILIPQLAAEYAIIGIAANRKKLAHHCEEFIRADLLHESDRLFSSVFARHEIDIVIWNAVRYFMTPLMQANRLTLHTEFDLAVALPLTCAQYYARAAAPQKKKFIAMASRAAFMYRPELASYSIVKQAEITLMKYLQEEIPSVSFCAIAPGGIPNTDPDELYRKITEQFEETGETLVRIDEKTTG